MAREIAELPHHLSGEYTMNRFLRKSVLSVACVLVIGACGGEDSASDNSSTSLRATVTAPVDIEPWAVSPSALDMTEGDSGVFDCPSGGTIQTVWGDATYTGDSSICTAAVYEGIITVKDGGLVSFDVSQGLAEYGSGSANGVTTESYGEWNLSFSLNK